MVAGRAIRDLAPVNGVRVSAQDSTSRLVRALSSKPELVVLVESPVSEARMRQMFKAVDSVTAHIRKWVGTIRRFDFCDHGCR